MAAEKFSKHISQQEINYPIYEKAVKRIRHELAHGRTYDQACDTLTDLDHEMRTFIKEDFLKILIAEEHFGAGQEIPDMALVLGLPCEKIEASMLDLLHDMVYESSQFNMFDNPAIH